MIDPETLNTASNIMVKAGYTLKQAAPAVPVDYTALAQGLLTIGTALCGIIAVIGRWMHAKTIGNKPMSAIISGSNVPATKPTVTPPTP